MKKRILIALCAIMAVAVASARLSDEEVMIYIQEQSALGKSEAQIGRELLARGVMPQQVERIKAKYENADNTGNEGTQNNTATGKINNTRGSRTQNMQETQSRFNTGATTIGGAPAADAASGTIPIPPGMAIQGYDAQGQPIYMVVEQQERTIPIFGHNVFSEDNLTFAPGTNLATPQDYTLGPGDEVIIDLWGENEEHMRQTISPEGSIMVAQLGPIYLSGNTVQQANKIVRDKFAKKYGGVNDARSEVSLALGQTRSIQVDVMGEVTSPGTFRLSPFATVFNALYNAGGINNIGTLRNIEVLRNGKRVSTVDIYDYLFKGKQTGNIRLKEGDVIIVPPYKELVTVEGNIKRPMKYEIKPGESVGTVIEYAGGFLGDAYSDMVRLTRSNGKENALVNVERGQFKTYRMKDGDLLTVGTISDRYNNRVELRGAVERPGQYAIGKDIFTVRDLINRAEGVREDAYTGRAMLYRQSPDLTLEVEALDLGAILSGAAPDIELRRNDMLVVSTVQELNEKGDLTIQGEVTDPGNYPYAKGTTIEDLIVQAGGLRAGASTARVDVARRILDPTATESSDRVAETFTLSIEKGLMVGEGSGFELQPYDVVTIYRSPTYQTQKFVTVAGEITFAGPYPLADRAERISQVIEKAGGVNQFAYLRGASLIRQMTEEEIKARDDALEFARINAATDSVSISRINLSNYYNVEIDLEKALANPGSQYDVVLKDKDRIFIPETSTTVAIQGEVMTPNTVTFRKGQKGKKYIDQAGGFTERANKGKVYVVYMNGNVEKLKRNTRIEPGSTIVVPSKSMNKRSIMSEIMGYVSSFTSLAVMAASIASLLKK